MNIEHLGQILIRIGKSRINAAEASLLRQAIDFAERANGEATVADLLKVPSDPPRSWQAWEKNVARTIADSWSHLGSESRSQMMFDLATKNGRSIEAVRNFVQNIRIPKKKVRK